MLQGPAPPEPTASPPQEHPEAHGFGSSRRWRWEVPIFVALLLGLPLLAVSGARWLAPAAALRLPPEMDATLGRPTWEALRVSGQRWSVSDQT